MTIEDRQESIILALNALDDWMDKYEFIIDRGKRVESLDARYKTDANAISGCQSKVWIVSEMKDGTLCFYADSDAMITRGLIGLLLDVLDSQRPEVIVEADMYFLERTGLQSNLSPSRANGLESIVRHMKRMAAKAVKNGHDSLPVS